MSDYINALLKKPIKRTPIWVMRQAGRYLPEYRATRAKSGGFMNLCKSPDLACEVTLQPIRRFDLDAAILFSDILTIPDAMGLGLYFVENEGPKFKKNINNIDDINQITSNVNDNLTYVFDAITNIKQELNNKFPLIGFSGSPWTLATYMIEGNSSKNFHKIKKMMFCNPEYLNLLLEKLSQAVFHYLNQQIISGVDSVMIFDTWGGLLAKQNYLDFSLNYMQKIVTKLKSSHPNIPITLFSKNGGKHLTKIADTTCNCIGIDWTIDIEEAVQLVGNKVAIQGNLDPALLLTNPEIIEKEVIKILNQFKEKTGHIFNLGHGITPDANPENMQALIENVHKFGAK